MSDQAPAWLPRHHQIMVLQCHHYINVLTRFPSMCEFISVFHDVSHPQVPVEPVSVKSRARSYFWRASTGEDGSKVPRDLPY